MLKIMQRLSFSHILVDNYFVHHWYDPWEDSGYLQGFPQGDIYSWYKGNVFPNDMEKINLDMTTRFVYSITVDL